jgi:hypothetical protein
MRPTNLHGAARAKAWKLELLRCLVLGRLVLHFNPGSTSTFSAEGALPARYTRWVAFR